MIVALLTDAKDRPTVRHKTRLKLGLKGAGADLTWPLFTASQDEKLNGLVNERTVQRSTCVGVRCWNWKRICCR